MFEKFYYCVQPNPTEPNKGYIDHAYIHVDLCVKLIGPILVFHKPNRMI